MISKRIASALLLVLTVSSGAAHAGLFSDDEARARVEQLKRENNARFDRLEQSQRGTLELSNQIEALRAELATLRGQIEVLTYELDAAQKRQKDFYVDLDNRLRKLEQVQQQAQEQAKNSPPSGPKADPADESRDYESALNLLKSGKYKEAGAAFEGFVGKYPDSQFQPSANYWAGSAFYQARDFGKAGSFFSKVTGTWPNDVRAPDAMLGLANCQQDSGDAKGARATLQTLVSKYPTSSAAQVAKQRLAKK